jgi:[ribosomal protein S5]-alanine N-acetyltransferase
MIEDYYETERLIIRKPLIDDHIQVFTKWAQDKEVTKYLTWTPHDNLQKTKSFIEYCIKIWGNDKYAYMICDKNTKDVMGMIDFRFDDFKANFGYLLGQRYWDYGYMTEVANKLLTEVIKIDKIYRIWAICDVENKGSANVMKKCGMEYEGILHRGIVHPNLSKEPRDCYLYAKYK